MLMLVALTVLLMDSRLVAARGAMMVLLLDELTEMMSDRLLGQVMDGLTVMKMDDRKDIEKALLMG